MYPYKYSTDQDAIFFYFFFVDNIPVLGKKVNDSTIQNDIWAFTLVLLGLILHTMLDESQPLYDLLACVISVLLLPWLFGMLVHALQNPYGLNSAKQDSKNGQYGQIKNISYLIMCEILAFFVTENSLYRLFGAEMLVGTSNNQSLSSFSILYYVIMTFSTVGYGDIHPVNVVGSEMLKEQLGAIMGTGMAIIISIAGFFTTVLLVGTVIAAIPNKNEAQ